MNKTLVFGWYEQYKTGIYRYALSILKDPHGAEDVLQETFLRLLSGKYAVREEKIQPWLYRVARNCCYDILRKRDREQEIPPELPSHEGKYAYIERIAVLDLTDREIVTLKVLGGMTCREIGKILGLTGPAVQKRYERAMKKLREQEEDYGNQTESRTGSSAHSQNDF